MHNSELQLIIVLSSLLLIAPFLSNLIKLPIVVVEILLGSLFSFFGFLPENHLFELLSEVGFLYLMFLAGMEVNLRELFKIEKKIFYLSLFFISLLYLLSIIVVWMFNLSNIYVVIFPLISVGLIVSLQKEIDKSDWISLAMTVGVIGELISIIALTVLSGVFSYGFSLELYKVITILFLLIFLFVIGYFVIKSVFWWFPNIKHIMMPNDDKYNQDIRISFAIFFLMISIMLFLDLDVVLGAFVAGMFVISFFYHNRELEHKLSPFGFGFLITLFFIHVGSGFNLNMLFNLELLKISIFILSIMFIIRIVSSLVFVKRIGRDNIIVFGLSLSMPLTLLIAIATIAYNGKSIDSLHYNAFILASIIEVLFVMLFIKKISQNKLPTDTAFIKKSEKKDKKK